MLLVVPLLFAATLRTPVESVVNAAYTAPPELGADILIRIAENATLADRATRVDLLERAFTLAEGARHPFKRWAGGIKLNQDSRQSRLADALDPGLSKLDLQCRAAKRTFGLDRARGMSLFERIPPPQPPALPCEDALSYRVDRYYDVAADIFQDGFTDKQRKRGEPVEFAARILGAISTPAQIEPAARMLGRLKLASSDYALLVISLGRAVAHMQADPRSFGATLAPGMLAPYLELANRCPRYGCSPSPLLEAMRSYLVAHMTGPRCSDTPAQLIDSTLSEFNAAVVSLTGATNPQPPPISIEETVPLRRDGAARVDSFDDAELRAAIEQAMRSNDRGPDEAPIRDFIAAFDRWKESSHPDAIREFHTEAALYVDGVSQVAAGPLRDAVIARAVAFLRDSPMLRESPPEWYLHVHEALKDGGADVAEEMRRTGGPVMAMYVEIERLLSGSTEQISTPRR